ncbi:MAG: cytochrome c [Gammaproteobacteria bacterium]|nr:cytochrome c [Gammaproteobacteria bacterium]
MKLLPVLLLQLLILISLTAHAQDGQALHQSECIECHSRMTGGDGHVIYSRDDRIVKNISELSTRVTHCSNGANTGWNANQIDAVTKYLNERYYNY